MKPGRQTIILEIIENQNIETQNQLLDALAERGIRSTQATLSRDIKDMRLIKEPGPNGRSHYVRPPESAQAHDSRLQKILKESVLSVELAQNLLVIKTLSGLASGACSAIDSIHIEGLVGSLAGDDTIFLAMRNEDVARSVLSELRDLL
ncbi:MAG: arginine repressor [Oscillospiraceae bacterium]|nr:arginine repressor [Oscillospiraceae bacterium]